MNPEGSTGASGAVMAYVLFYDIVGSSQLTTDSQQVITSQLQKLVVETPQFRQAKERRQLVSIPTGDGAALIFLDKMEDPANCALSIAHALKADPFCQLRMGIHSGPVILVEDINGNRNASGAGINIAERVMSTGDSGHILLSETAADSLRQLTRWRTKIHELGPCQTKDRLVPLFNLYDEEVGNPAWPKKSRRQQIRTRNFRIGMAAILLLLVAGLPSLHHFLPGAPERVRYSMQVKPPNSEARIIAREMVFPAGFQVRFLMDGRNGGYLYMANQGPNMGGGSLWTWLYPSVPNGAVLKSGATASTNYFKVDAMQGKELVFLIWSDSPIPEFDKVIDSFQHRKFDGSLNAAEAAIVQDVITRSKEAETEQGPDATILRGSARVLVKRIVLEHL